MSLTLPEEPHQPFLGILSMCEEVLEDACDLTWVTKIAWTT